MVGRCQRLMWITAYAHVRKSTSFQRIAQDGITPAEDGVLWWQGHDHGVDVVPAPFDHPPERIDGHARANRLGSILLGERVRQIVVDSDIRSGDATSPRAHFGNHDGAV